MSEIRLPGVLPAWFAEIPPAELRAVAEKCERLVALWASDETTHFAAQVALASRERLLWLKVALPREHPRYPGIADLFPSASRMQRAAYDLVGVHPEGGADHRKWLRHGAWPAGSFQNVAPARMISDSTDFVPSLAKCFDAPRNGRDRDADFLCDCRRGIFACADQRQDGSKPPFNFQ